ncbi:MAG TPA: PspC domain-containing protein [Edaphobacter sp.]
MFCTRCGSKLEPTARFCSSCGAPVASASSAYAPPSPPYTDGRLVRPRNNRMIAGVCAAFAQAYGWDVAIVRIVVAVLCLTGVSALAYVIAWIIIPEEPFAPLPPQN